MEDFAKRDRVVERKEVMLFDESAFRETMVNSIVATSPFNRLGDKIPDVPNSRFQKYVTVR